MNLEGLFFRSEKILATRQRQETNKVLREQAKLREAAKREAQEQGLDYADDEFDDEYSSEFEDPLATDDEDDTGTALAVGRSKNEGAAGDGRGRRQGGQSADDGSKKQTAAANASTSTTSGPEGGGSSSSVNKASKGKTKKKKRGGKQQRGDPEAAAGLKKQVHRRVSYASETPHDIHDIVRIQDAHLRPTATTVMTGLETEVRKGGREAKKTHDSIKCELEQKRIEMQDVMAQIQEASQIARALGYHDILDEQERVGAIEAVSRKKMFLAGTPVDAIEEEIADKGKQMTKIRENGEVFIFMLERLKREQSERNKLIKELNKELHAAKLQLQKQQRTTAMRDLELTREKLAYEELSKDVMEKLSLWDKEIADRRTFQQEKDSFTEFYLAEVIQKRQLVKELHETGSKQRSTAGGFAAAAVSMNAREKAKGLLKAKIERTRKRKAAAKAREEEKAYKRAFMQLGLTRSDVLGPLESDVDGPPISEIELQSSLVSKIKRKENIHTELVETKARLEAEQAHLRAEVAAKQTARQEMAYANGGAMSTSAEEKKVTNRDLANREQQLASMESKAAKWQRAAGDLRRMLEPCRLGLQYLSAKVLGVKAEMRGFDESNWVLVSILRRLQEVTQQWKRYCLPTDEDEAKRTMFERTPAYIRPVSPPIGASPAASAAVPEADPTLYPEQNTDALNRALVRGNVKRRPSVRSSSTPLRTLKSGKIVNVRGETIDVDKEAALGKAGKAAPPRVEMLPTGKSRTLPAIDYTTRHAHRLSVAVTSPTPKEKFDDTPGPTANAKLAAVMSNARFTSPHNVRVNARTLTPRATLLLSEQISDTGAKDAKKGGAADEIPDARSNLLEIMAAGDSPSRDSKDSDDDDDISSMGGVLSARLGADAEDDEEVRQARRDRRKQKGFASARLVKARHLERLAKRAKQAEEDDQ